MKKVQKNKGINKCILITIVYIILIVAAVELGFRGYLQITNKGVITVLSKQEVLDKAWFKPHPHLLYIFKPSNSFVMNAFDYGKFTTNQFGFRSTLEFDMKTVVKPADTLRIATLGGSTTMGVNNDNEVWPYLIGKYMHEHGYKRKIEILNEGIMGYTSLDNLLDLSTRVIDFNCDVYIIYLGVNDLLLSKAPVDIYRTDHSHFRRTLHENLNYLSSFPKWSFKLAILRAIFHVKGIPDTRDLVANTSTSQFWRDFKVPQDEMQAVTQRIRQTIVRNIISMIGIIRTHNPKAVIILSSFFDLKDTNGIVELNQDLARLSHVYSLAFVDAVNTIPREQEMAYDYGHFTPEGDRRMGEMFAKSILSSLSTEEKNRTN